MRGPLAGLVALVAALVLPLALVSAWTAHQVTDRAGYVAATGRLATDPVVRREVEQRLVALVERTVPGDPDAVFPGAGALSDTLLRQAVAGAVRSDLFRRTWVAANRAAHAQLLAILRGDAGAGRVTLDLAPLLSSVVDELATAGLPVADVPVRDTRITLATGQRLEPVQRVYGVLDAIGYLGALAWVVLAVVALLLARSRARTAVVLAVGCLVTAGASLLALVAARDQAVASASAPARDRDLVRAVAEVLTDSLQRGFEVAVVAAVVVALAALLLGLLTRRRAA